MQAAGDAQTVSGGRGGPSAASRPAASTRAATICASAGASGLSAGSAGAICGSSNAASVSAASTCVWRVSTDGAAGP